MALKYTNIFHCQEPPKFTQIGIFGVKNKPSGNPDWNAPIIIEKEKTVREAASCFAILRLVSKVSVP
jgi:hypothetical protein